MADLLGPVEPAPHVAAGQASLHAAAGSTATAQVTITNLAGEPRVMSLTAHGLDPAWLPAPSRSPALAPGESIVADLVLHPSVGTIAARYPLAVAVQALDPVTGFATGPTALAELVLVVDAPGQIALTVAPAEARAVFGKRIRVELRNDGALPARVDLQAQAPRSARLTLPTGGVDVPPQQSVTVRGRIRPRRVRLFGQRERHAYTVTARSAGAPRHVEGVLTTRAVLGPRTALATVLLTVVAVWVALAIVYIPKLADRVKSGTSVTAVQAAGSGSPSPGNGGSGSNGGSSGATGSGGSGGKSGGNGATKAGGNNASTVQLNGVVAGSSPNGVTVSLQPTSLVDEAAEGAIPVGVTTQSDSEVGMIPAEALVTRTARTAQQHRTVSTTADGAWSFPAVPKPGYYLLTFAKPGFQTARYIIDSATAAATKPLNVTMSAGQGQLNGVVTGPHGRVGGASVTITDGTNTITTSTDSTGDIGSWSVVGLSTPSTYLVSASADGLGTESRLVPLAASGSATVSLALRAGIGSITGSVTSIGGDQLGGVTVTATDGTTTRSATTVTEGGLRGRYTLSGLAAPGKYTITFAAQGYLQQTIRVTLGQGQSQVASDVTLFPSTATVTGSVTSDGGGSTPGALVGAGLTLTSSDNAYKTTSGDGGAYQFDGVAPGDYVLSAQYAGLTTVFKSLTVAAGSTAPITVPAFELTTPATAVSSASIVGFVSDGTNPSNTLCPTAPSKCTVMFTLRTQDGVAVPLAQNSLAAAPAGPTAYTLVPSQGIEPGLYKLTISATNYLPVTVGVQVPLTGIASAPATSLYPANSIDGAITAPGDLTNNGTGTPVVNCVYLVPTGGTAPNLTTPCSASNITASSCSATGAPGAAYAEIKTDDSFTLTDLCDGTYLLYFAIHNSWYVNPAPLPVTLSHGQVLSLPVTVTRLGQISLTLQQIPLSQRKAIALPASTQVAITCIGFAGSVTQTITTDGTASTAYVVGGLATGIWNCTGTIPASPNFTPSSTGVQYTSNGQVTAAGLVFTQTLGTFFGRVTTSWSGTPTGVSGGQVTVSGTTAFVNGTAVTKSTTVTPDSNGCFAITTNGTIPASVTVPSDCTGGISGAAIGTLALVQNVADFATVAPAGYVSPGSLTDQPVSEGGLVSISLDPNPVAVSGLLLQSQPTGDFTGFTLAATARPPGAGTISFSVSPYTDPITGEVSGAITWQDSKLAAGQIAPGTYTITATKNGYQDGSLTFTCAAATNCDLTGQALVVKKLGSLQINLGTTADATVTLRSGAAVIGSPQTASGGVVTFPGLAPNPGAAYAIDVKAAGYQFGSSDGANPVVALDCGGSPTISIPAGGTAQCTATLARDGAITGYVKGVLGADAATDPTQGLANLTVTATNGTLSFQAKTQADGSYTITGTAAQQGLDAGTWTVSVGAVTGYTPTTGVSKSVTIATADITAGTATTAPEIDFFVQPVAVTLTITDQNGAPASGVTVTGPGSITGTETTTGTYSLGNLIPGTYTLTLKLAGYMDATATINVQATGQAQSFPAHITQSASQVNGTVSAAQGSSTIPTGLAGATVCITTLATAPCGSSSPSSSVVTGTDTKKLWLQPTGSSGGFTFTTVPDSPAGGYYLRVERYGYQPYVSGSFSIQFGVTASPITFPVTLNRVTQTVVITVTASSSADNLTGSSAATLTSAGSGGTSPLDIPANAALSPTIAMGSSTNTFTIATGLDQVPYGCWTFSFTAPTDHYGTLSTPTGGSGDLTCPAGSFQVPGTGSNEVDINYIFNEYQPQVKLTLNPLALDPSSAPVPTTVVQGGSTIYSTTLTLPPAGLNQALPVWVNGSTHVVFAPASPWTVDNADTTVSSGSPTATATVSEQGSTVTITLDNSVNNVTVTLTSPGFGSPTATTKGGGIATFPKVPYGTWTASATGYTDATVTVSGATASGTLNHI